MFPAVSGWCHATRPPPSAVPSQPTLLLYVLNFNERRQDTEIHIYFYLKIKIKLKIKPHRGQKIIITAPHRGDNNMQGHDGIIDGATSKTEDKIIRGPGG